MGCNGLYFLFFCRGFKLTGPMVIMIYRSISNDKVQHVTAHAIYLSNFRMLAQDLMRFGIIYTIFIMGFAQAYYIIFQSFAVSHSLLE